MKIEGLTVEERLKLVEDIWDSIAADQQTLPLTKNQRSRLDRRLEDYRLDKNPGKSGIEVIKRIRRSL